MLTIFGQTFTEKIGQLKWTKTTSIFVLILFILMCVPAYLPACLHVYHMCAIPAETRGGCQSSRNWSYKQLLVIM